MFRIHVVVHRIVLFCSICIMMVNATMSSKSSLWSSCGLDGVEWFNPHLASGFFFSFFFLFFSYMSSGDALTDPDSSCLIRDRLKGKEEKEKRKIVQLKHAQDFKVVLHPNIELLCSPPPHDENCKLIKTLSKLHQNLQERHEASIGPRKMSWFVN